MPVVSTAVWHFNTVEELVQNLPLFNVEDAKFAGGAVGDGVTDDYPCIKAAWDAMLASETGGLVFFPRAVEYRVNLGVSGRVAVDGAGAYAAFRLPDVTPDSTQTKRVRGILGVGYPFVPRQFPNEGTELASKVMTSAVLLVDYDPDDFAWSSSNGLPSVIGAPDADKGAAITSIFSFTNLHFVADKITIRQPANPSLCAMNLESCSTAQIGEVGIDVAVALDQVPEPTHPTGAALLMPRVQNNVTTVIEKLIAVGHYTGAPFCENLDCRAAIVLRCKIAIPFRRNAFHAGRFAWVDIEQSPWGLAGYDPSGTGPNLGIVEMPAGDSIVKIEFIKWEDTDNASGLPENETAWIYTPEVGAHVWDPSNRLRGVMVGYRNDVLGAGSTDHLWIGGATNFNIFGVFGFNIAGSTRIDAGSHAPANPATDPPNTPTIGTATAGNASASVAFTPAGSGATADSYRAISTPGSFTGTGSSSPITVSGLTNGTGYTFTVRAQNGAGNSSESSASNSVTPTSGGGGSPTTLASDTFTRADAGSLGTADVGGTWTQPGSGSNWSIVSNTARTTITDETLRTAYLSVGATDVVVQADIVHNGSDGGLIARVTDENNFILLDIGYSNSTTLQGNLFKRVSGSYTALASLFTVTVTNGSTHTVRLECQGSTIRGYVDDVLKATGSDSSVTGNKAGVARLGGSGHTIIDNFSVTTI